MNRREPSISHDLPLHVGSALAGDLLNRRSFATTVAAALWKVSSSAGLVVSVEGAWGSGKTSLVAMVEELLDKEPREVRPIVVRFNPWLIGEREALLRHFLARIADAIKLTDHSKHGRAVAREIKAYAKAFDLIKLIPGAEPWASLVKSVMESAGDATGVIADYKTPDLDKQKQRVEETLVAFPRPIVVFIDDIDRLFPAEVFEMVRIVKAVGGLPNVAYLVAWDAAYVRAALATLNVPQPDMYLDKVVQLRMPLPSLSASARERLVDEAMKQLDPEALETRFKDDGHRVFYLYYAGLRDLLEHPRDVTRVFNTVRVIEPFLRGEVALADIIGLAALMVKASPVFDLLRRHPGYFVGRLPDEKGLLGNSDDIVSQGASARDNAYQACAAPAHVRRIVYFLFPVVAKSENAIAFTQSSHVDGHISHPTRLLVALQLSVSPSEVSIVLARRYLMEPAARQSISVTLANDNCLDFLELLGDVAATLAPEDFPEIERLCIDIGVLADREPFVARAKAKGMFSRPPEDLAIRTIQLLIQASGNGAFAAVAEKIVMTPGALSVAAQILRQSGATASHPHLLAINADSRERALESFADNVIAACRSTTFFAIASSGHVLWMLGREYPQACRTVFETIRSVDPTLDAFALEFLRYHISSNKGPSYRLPEHREWLEAFCPLDEFRLHAAARLDDPSLGYPCRAAWEAVIKEKAIYGIDGSDARD